MYAFNRFAAALGFALVSVHAQATEFAFTSGATSSATPGNTYTATVDGVTLTASAWSNANRAEKFEAAVLQIDPGLGMGACIGSSCSATLDNANGSSSMILFSFSSSVKLQSLNLQQLGSDSDLSLWAGVGNTFSPANMKPTKLGTASLYENTNPVAGIRTVDLTAFTGSYDWIAVAARIGQTDDLARLKSLMVNPAAQPVPDAATWMTMLAGLGLVGFRVNRRTRA